MNRDLLRENVKLQMLLTEYAEGILERTLQKAERFSSSHQSATAVRRESSSMSPARHVLSKPPPSRDRHNVTPSSTKTDDWSVSRRQSPHMHSLPYQRSDRFDGANTTPTAQHTKDRPFRTPSSAPAAQRTAWRSEINRRPNTTRPESRYSVNESESWQRPSVITSVVGWFRQKASNKQINIPSYLHDR